MKTIIQVVLLALGLFVSSFAVNACECDPPSQHRRLRSADVVFIGEGTLSGERAGLNTNKDFANFPHLATFEVEKQWKGKRLKQATAFVDLKGLGMCQGFDFEVGQRDLVYARRKSNFLLVKRSFCAPSKNINEVESEIKNLNNFIFRAYSLIYPYPKF